MISYVRHPFLSTNICSINYRTDLTSKKKQIIQIGDINSYINIGLLNNQNQKYHHNTNAPFGSRTLDRLGKIANHPTKCVLILIWFLLAITSCN